MSKLKTAIIQIRKYDDMSQADWSSYIYHIHSVLSIKCDSLMFYRTDTFDVISGVLWDISIKKDHITALEKELKVIKDNYEQDDIKVWVVKKNKKVKV